jgi:hypothetical protein
MDYRSLTEEEISQLEENGCRADDWSNINVVDDFQPTYIHNVTFYGHVNMGVFERSVEVEENFFRHSGVFNATLNNVTVGDNCLIENVFNYISGYDIGESCYISNVGTMSVTAGATFGEGNEIAVLNENGVPNVKLFSGLTSQMAALMVKRSADVAFRHHIYSLIDDGCLSAGGGDDDMVDYPHADIGYRVKIVNTREIQNCRIGDDCEVSGASRLSESTLLSTPDASILVGSDVICDNSIVQAGSSLLDGAKIDNCFVGEACHIGKGFSAESSVFFANSYMDNGESCAAFCGPFTVSHHKSTLLIGGMYSFYNAGSNTNFSNHAYKLGPIHYGIMERGSKTASGAHVLWPAKIGAFSMVMGKIQNHPDTSDLPFSYIIANGDTTYVVPGRNLTTVGTYRDVNKWPKRDKRPRSGRQSMVNFEWLSPYVVSAVIRGKRILENLRSEQGTETASYSYNGCLIKNSALIKGLELYDLAIRLFIGAQVKRHHGEIPRSTIGTGEWCDLSGLLIPDSEEQQLTGDIAAGGFTDIADIADEFVKLFNKYEDYKWAWTYRAIVDYYGVDTLGDEEISRMMADYEQANRELIAAVHYDAEREYRLGDVDDDTLKDFLEQLEKSNK